MSTAISICAFSQTHTMREMKKSKRETDVHTMREREREKVPTNQKKTYSPRSPSDHAEISAEHVKLVLTFAANMYGNDNNGPTENWLLIFHVAYNINYILKMPGSMAEKKRHSLAYCGNHTKAMKALIGFMQFKTVLIIIALLQTPSAIDFVGVCVFFFGMLLSTQRLNEIECSK